MNRTQKFNKRDQMYIDEGTLNIFKNKNKAYN